MNLKPPLWLFEIITLALIMGVLWGIYEGLAILGEWAYTVFIEDFVKETIREMINK